MTQRHDVDSVQHRMETDVEFRRAEELVRSLEKQLNLLRPQVQDLEDRFVALDNNGNDRAALRVKLELDHQRVKLDQTRLHLEEAWAARNGLLTNKS